MRHWVKRLVAKAPLESHADFRPAKSHDPVDIAVTDFAETYAVRTNMIMPHSQPPWPMDESRHSPASEDPDGLLRYRPWCSSPAAARDQERSSSLKSLALSRIRRSVKKSPGSVRRRSLEIWSADSAMFVRD